MLVVAIVATLSCHGREPVSLFPELQGWKKGEEASWGPDNLYVPIDGAADLFLRYRFERMRSIEYKNADGNSVNVEVYRQATPLDAFGIYSQGRPARDSYLDIGVQAYAEPDSLTLLAGSHYIELRSNSDAGQNQTAMREIAQKLAEKLNDGARFPSFFSLFPAEGKKACSEKYIARDVLGYDFLKNAYEVDYVKEGQTLSLYVCRGETPLEAEAMFSKFLGQQNMPTGAVSSLPLEVVDKYHGSVLLVRAGSQLILASGKVPSAQKRAMVERLKISLEQIEKQTR
jgi:hypothetical protein